MAAIKLRISDGVNLSVIETDKFKTNYISVNFLVKLDKATAAYNALLPKVLKRGTVNYPDMAAINRQLEYLYATNLSTRLYKRGETQIFGFGAYVLDNSFALGGEDILGGVLDMFGEIIFSPLVKDGAFDAEYVESEKRNLIDDINAQINNKTSYAVRRCQEEMCRDEVFGISELGTVEDIKAITAQSLYEHYLKVLNTAEIEVYFVGRKPADLDERLKKMFAQVSHIAGTPLSTEVIRTAAEVRDITEEEQVKQGKLSLGFRTGKVLSDGDYHKFSLFCELYGGSPTSKLFMNVREKLSLCYYCRTIPEAQKGIMIVASGIENEKRDTAQAEILAQLENVKNGDITDEELDSAKRSIINGYREIYDTPSALESWYMGRALAGIGGTPEEAAELIKNTTKEEIMEVAKGMTLDTVYFMRGTLDGGEEDDR